MRKLEILLILLCTALTGQAQDTQDEYRPMAVEGRMWQIQVGGVKENDYCYRIEGDTLIEGETWKKVYTAHWPVVYNYYAAIRDVDKKVFAIAKGSSTPRLLYDFGLKVGDRVRCGVESNAFECLKGMKEQVDSMYGFPLGNFLKVKSIDTYEKLGQKSRRFILELNTPFEEPLSTNSVVWTEGIGSFSGPFLPWMPMPDEQVHFVHTCRDGKEGHSISEWNFLSEENAIISPVSETRSGSEVLYDLQGRHITSKPSKKVYIENGRKHVVR